MRPKQPICKQVCLQVAALRDCFSEYALIKFRILVECRWLQMLSATTAVSEVPQFSDTANHLIDSFCEDVTLQIAQEVKHIERTTNHDVKAVEYVLKTRLSHDPELKVIMEFVHFACTSEDINNLSHALMLQQARDEEILPLMDELIEQTCSMAEAFAGADFITCARRQSLCSAHIG